MGLSFRAEHNLGAGCRHMAWSANRGETFGKYFAPAVGSGCIPDPVCQGSLLALGGGRLVLTSGPGSPSSRTKLTVHASSDGGQTFMPLISVDEGAAMYSDLVEI